MTTDDLIDAAIAYQTAGKLDAAEAIYSRLLAADPANAEVHDLLGTLLQTKGDLPAAVEHHVRATELNPNDAASFHNLGVALHAQRDVRSIAALQQAVRLDPRLIEAFAVLGEAFSAAGHFGPAASAFAKALELRPDDPVLLNNLGVAQRYCGQPEAAIATLIRARELAPGLFNVRDHLARAFHEARRPADGVDDTLALIEMRPEMVDARALALVSLNAAQRYNEAIEIARQSIERFPDELEMHYQLAIAFQASGEFAPAIIALRRCLELDSHNIAALNRLGHVMFQIGQAVQAVEVLTQVIALPEANVDSYMTLSVARLAIQDNEGAIAAGRKAVEMEPKNPLALLQLNAALLRAGQHDEVDRLLENAEDRVGPHGDLHMQRGSVAGDRGEARTAVEHFRRAIEMNPSIGRMGGVAAMFLNYLDSQAPADTFAAHKNWAEQFADVVGATDRDPSRFDITVESDRKLRIGYLSPDFRGHSVAFFLIPLLKHHDREKFTIVCFDSTRTLDTVSESMHKMADEWYRVVGISDKAVADIIRKRQIDILIDLAGHTSDSRLPALAYRPAPVQVTYLGYPNTTGLSTVDYRIVDSFTDPPGDADCLSVEQLVRIDPVFLAYSPVIGSPEIGPLPAESNGFVTFGSFNNFLKVSDATMRMWCDVMRGVPRSRLLLKSAGLGNATTRARIAARFASYGISEDRLDFVSRINDTYEHLNLYNKVDVALDTFPYSGTTTTCEAIWMGVPVVTRVGDVHASRVSGSLLRTIGVPDLLANDHRGYVEVAVELARNPMRLASLRRTLRECVTKSPLVEHETLTRKIEAAYRAMWHRWCATPR